MDGEKLLWILEDDESCQFVFGQCLETRYSLRFFETVEDLREALKTLANGAKRPNLLLADLRLPGESFLRFLSSEENCKLIEDLPFMVVSSLGEVDVLQKCFEHGAIDYLTKPFSEGELLVKIERMLRSLEIEKSDVQIDLLRLNLNSENGSVKLTPKEMQILSILKKSYGKAVEREQIVRQVWGGVEVGQKTLDVHLFNLRKKAKTLGISIDFVPPQSLMLIDGNAESLAALKTGY